MPSASARRCSSSSPRAQYRPVPAMITGRSAPAQQLRRLARRSAALPGSAARAAGALRLGFHEDDVERVVEEGRAGRDAPAAASIAARGRLGDRAPVSLTVSARLGQRGDERDVVDLLERPRAPAHLRRPAAEHDQRRAVLLRAGDRAHPVGHAGPGGQRRDPGLARRLRPALGRPGRRLLVANVDDPDPLVLAAVEDREQVAAGEREELVTPRERERAGDEAPAVDRPLGAALGAGASSVVATSGAYSTQSSTAWSATPAFGSPAPAAAGEPPQPRRRPRARPAPCPVSAVRSARGLKLR